MRSVEVRAQDAKAAGAPDNILGKASTALENVGAGGGRDNANFPAGGAAATQNLHAGRKEEKTRVTWRSTGRFLGGECLHAELSESRCPARREIGSGFLCFFFEASVPRGAGAVAMADIFPGGTLSSPSWSSARSEEYIEKPIHVCAIALALTVSIPYPKKR